MGTGKFGRSAETRSSESTPAEANGSKSLEMQLRLQTQQEELSQLQQEQVKLREELASQKVHLSLSLFHQVCTGMDNGTA